MGIYNIRDGKPVEPADDGEVHVQREFIATVGIVGSEEWAHIAVQSVFVDDGMTGFEFRIGQYRFFGSDAVRLINELAHYGQISGEFRPADKRTPPPPDQGNEGATSTNLTGKK